MSRQAERHRWLILLATYLVILHAAIIAIFVRPDMLLRAGAFLKNSSGKEFFFDTRTFRSANTVLDSTDRMIQSAPVVFMGDSIVQDLPPFSDLPRSLNLGLGGKTMRGIAAMMHSYPSLHDAAGIVLAIGINDICNGNVAVSEISLRLNAISEALPPTVPIVWSGILPTDARMPHSVCTTPPGLITIVNGLIATLCLERGRCTYSDGFSQLADSAGFLQAQFHIGDGVHLNSVGYAVWSEQLRHDIERSGIANR